MIVFVSNFYNHHQSYFSEAMYRLTDGAFRFVSTEPMSEERIKLGWGGEKAPFVEEYSENPEACQRLIDEADAVIYGSAPREILENRIEKKKLTFFYSERQYKKECPWYKRIVHAWRYRRMWGSQENHYLLCASAYAAYDYARVGTFVNQAYVWGYFPEVKKYEEIAEILSAKKKNSILWAGRFVDFKHPELPILVAQRLKREGCSFDMKLIGNGEMEAIIKEMIEKYEMQDCVQMLGSMNHKKVRDYMEKTQIFLFTSDRNEGWGAVLNESMNSACAVVASHAIGSVPYMLEDHKNGLIYQDGDFESLYQSVKNLLQNRELCEKLGENAYETMIHCWNADMAAERLLALVKNLQRQKEGSPFSDGPCSPAVVIKDNWF